MGDGNEQTKKKENSGIPEAIFLDDVDQYMKDEKMASAETMLQKLDETYQKYKLFEVNLVQKKRRLKQQLPDLKSTLEIVKHLHSKKDSKEEISTRFLLSGAVHAKAKIPPTDEVCLWLGANVMLTYTTQEALEVLTKNYNAAVVNLESINNDLDYLRDQFTTTEVTMARLYNWDVKQKMAKKKTQI